MAASKLPSCFSELIGSATAAAAGEAAVVPSGTEAPGIFEVSGFVIRLAVLEAELFFVSAIIASPVLARRTISVYTRPRRACATGPLPQARFPQKPRGFLRRRRIDVKPRPPFESRHLGQLGHDLQVPVVVRQRRFLHGRAVHNEIVRRPLQRLL